MIQVADSGTANHYYQLRIRGGGQAVCATKRLGGSQLNADASASPTNGAWHHACGIFISSGDDQQAYMDGANKGTQGSGGTPSGIDNTAIGRLSDSSPSEYFDGEVAEAAIWNVELTAAEIASLAAGYCPLFVRPGSIKAYWPLGGALSADDSDTDVVGGYHMTDNNSPTTAAHPPIIYPSYPIVIAAAAGNAARAMHHYRMLRCS